MTAACTCAAEGIEDLGPGIPPSAYPALQAQCRRHGALAYERDGVRLYTGHVLDVLAELPADSVDCCVTSPPYWSLRKYEGPTDTIWGGDPACAHEWGDIVLGGESYTGVVRWEHGDPSVAKTRSDFPESWQKQTPQGQFCTLCSCWRGQLGLEPTVEAFIEHLMTVMAAIWRVLKPTGVCWVNLGDSYASAWSAGSRRSIIGQTVPPPKETRHRISGSLKEKDLVLVPERFVLAAQAQGWWVRSRIAWTKPNPMPESARDRPTDAWETIYMLTKRARYWYDAEAVREPHQDRAGGPERFGVSGVDDAGQKHDPVGLARSRVRFSVPALEGYNPAGRNMRNVWQFPTAPMPLAHFATFPPELPARCIAASCPAEVCTQCGKARERVVAKTFVKLANRREGRKAHTGEMRDINSAEAMGFNQTETTGWTDCGCGAPFAPGVVLDPFAGSGTTLIEARKLGRQAIGIEISPEYAEMARKRLDYGVRGVQVIAAGQAVLL